MRRMDSKIEADAIYRYCIDQCNRIGHEPLRHKVGEKWDAAYYSWGIIPLNQISECSALNAEIIK